LQPDSLIPLRRTSSAPLDLGGEALEELLLYGRTMMLFQLLPFGRLRREHEIHYVPRQKTQLAVVVLGAAPAVASRRRLAERRLPFAGENRIAGTRVRAVLQQGALDRILEGTLGNIGTHSGSVPWLRMFMYPSY
jgi:hypothetical protein